MSRAFIKESEGDEGPPLPELQISPHRNLVTPRGLERIQSQVRALQAALGEARAAGDRAVLAQVQRDLRYWSERLRTAEVVPLPAGAGEVRFGSTVTLEAVDGARLRYQVVGEDEAEPREGRISYVSPLAAALLGAATGDEVEVGGRAMEVVAIE
jgi:transcription elongation GreA/GreB family factor